METFFLCRDCSRVKDGACGTYTVDGVIARHRFGGCSMKGEYLPWYYNQKAVIKAEAAEKKRIGQQKQKKKNRGK